MYSKLSYIAGFYKVVTLPFLNVGRHKQRNPHPFLINNNSFISFPNCVFFHLFYLNYFSLSYHRSQKIYYTIKENNRQLKGNVKNVYYNNVIKIRK